MARPPRPEPGTGSGGAMDSNQPIKPIQPGLPAIPARHPAGGWQAGLGQEEDPFNCSPIKKRS